MTFSISFTRRLLDALTIVLVATGIFFWFHEPSLPHPFIPAGSSGAQTTSRDEGRSPRADASIIVASNIFSATRAAPAVRYTPDDGASMGAVPVVGSSGETVVADEAPPTLYGIMMGPGGTRALIQSDSAGATSRLYREGDRVGQFKVEKILASSVILRSHSGRVELKVEHREVSH